MAVMPNSRMVGIRRSDAADAEGNDGGARRFQHRMIGIAAHPHLIIEAMHDAMAGAQARRASSRARRHRPTAMHRIATSAIFMAVPVEPEVRWTRDTASGFEAR